MMTTQPTSCSGYIFHDTTLLAHALAHRSAVAQHASSNERLEFLGDAILGQVVSAYLFKILPHEDEGRLTQIKGDAVSRDACARAFQALDIASCIRLGKAMDARAIASSIYAGAYEAVIAAIYLDGGIEAAGDFILRTLQVEINRAQTHVTRGNPKAALQEIIQQVAKIAPVYHVVEEIGPEHSKQFVVCVEIAGQRFSEAIGVSKKRAQQAAAEVVLHTLGLVDDEGEMRDIAEASQIVQAWLSEIT